MEVGGVAVRVDHYTCFHKKTTQVEVGVLQRCKFLQNFAGQVSLSFRNRVAVALQGCLVVFLIVDSPYCCI